MEGVAVNLSLAALALAAVSLAVVAGLAVNRLRLDSHERSRRRDEERLKPLALAIAAGESPDGVAGLNEREAEVLADLALRYVSSIAGESADSVTRFFERHGYVERELARLNSRRAWRRAAAAYTLGGMGSEKAVEALKAALFDRDGGVRVSAARALGRIGSAEAAPAIADALVQGGVPRIVAADALLAIGPSARAALRRLSGHDEPEVRGLALEVLGQVGDVDDSPLALARLTDTSAQVRVAAAKALYRIGDEQAVEGLRLAAGDRVPAVRAAVSEALGAVRDRESLDNLHYLARYDDFAPARAAARAIARIDPLLLWRLAAVPGSSPHLREASTVLQVTGVVER